jgi:hypothetical protein
MTRHYVKSNTLGDGICIDRLPQILTPPIYAARLDIVLEVDWAHDTSYLL